MKYEVIVTVRSGYRVVVEAESEHEAVEKGIDADSPDIQRQILESTDVVDAEVTPL